jgi:hypothetical protein
VKAFVPVAQPVLERFRDSFKERGITMEFHVDGSRPFLSFKLVPPKPTPDDFSNSKNDRVEVQLCKGLHASIRYEYVWVTCRGGHFTRAYGGYSGQGNISDICSVKLLEELIQKLSEQYVYYFIEKRY